MLTELFLYGAIKHIKANLDQSDADETNKEAKQIARRASTSVNRYKKNCGAMLDRLGQRKVYILDNSIKPFIAEFEKLNAIKLQESIGLNELQKIVLNRQSFRDLKKMQATASSVALSLASSSLTVGSLAAIGAAGGATLLGGIIAAGPGMAVTGFFRGAKAAENKEVAHANRAKAYEYAEEMKTVEVAVSGIRRRAAMFDHFLLSLNSIFEPLVYDMTQIIKNNGTDFSQYSEADKNTIMSALSIAGAIKAVIDTPILDANGKLTEESGMALKKIEKNVHKALK